MAQGDAVKAQRILVKAKGWDPSELTEANSIGLPVDIQKRAAAWNPPAASYQAEEKPLDKLIETSDTDQSRATKNANPTPGKPGA